MDYEKWRSQQLEVSLVGDHPIRRVLHRLFPLMVDSPMECFGERGIDQILEASSHRLEHPFPYTWGAGDEKRT